MAEVFKRYADMPLDIRNMDLLSLRKTHHSPSAINSINEKLKTLEKHLLNTKNSITLVNYFNPILKPFIQRYFGLGLTNKYLTRFYSELAEKTYTYYISETKQSIGYNSDIFSLRNLKRNKQIFKFFMNDDDPLYDVIKNQIQEITNELIASTYFDQATSDFYNKVIDISTEIDALFRQFTHGAKFNCTIQNSKKLIDQFLLLGFKEEDIEVKIKDKFKPYTKIKDGLNRNDFEPFIYSIVKMKKRDFHQFEYPTIIIDVIRKRLEQLKNNNILLSYTFDNQIKSIILNFENEMKKQDFKTGFFSDYTTHQNYFILNSNISLSLPQECYHIENPDQRKMILSLIPFQQFMENQIEYAKLKEHTKINGKVSSTDAIAQINSQYSYLTTADFKPFFNFTMFLIPIKNNTQFIKYDYTLGKKINDKEKIASELKNKFDLAMDSRNQILIDDLKKEKDVLNKELTLLKKTFDATSYYRLIKLKFVSVLVSHDYITFKLISESDIFNLYAKKLRDYFLQTSGLLALLKPKAQYEDFDGSRGILDISKSILSTLNQANFNAKQKFTKKLKEEPAHIFSVIDSSGSMSGEIMSCFFFVNVFILMFEQKLKNIILGNIGSSGSIYELANFETKEKMKRDPQFLRKKHNEYLTLKLRIEYIKIKYQNQIDKTITKMNTIKLKIEKQKLLIENKILIIEKNQNTFILNPNFIATYPLPSDYLDEIRELSPIFLPFKDKILIKNDVIFLKQDLKNLNQLAELLEKSELRVLPFTKILNDNDCVAIILGKELKLIEFNAIYLDNISEKLEIKQLNTELINLNDQFKKEMDDKKKEDFKNEYTLKDNLIRQKEIELITLNNKLAEFSDINAYDEQIRLKYEFFSEYKKSEKTRDKIIDLTNRKQRISAFPTKTKDHIEELKEIEITIAKLNFFIPNVKKDYREFEGKLLQQYNSIPTAIFELYNSFAGGGTTTYVMEDMVKHPIMNVKGLKYFIIITDAQVESRSKERWFNPYFHRMEAIGDIPSVCYWLEVLKSRKDTRFIYIWIQRNEASNTINLLKFNEYNLGNDFSKTDLISIIKDEYEPQLTDFYKKIDELQKQLKLKQITEEDYNIMRNQYEGNNKDIIGKVRYLDWIVQNWDHVIITTREKLNEPNTFLLMLNKLKNQKFFIP